MNSLMADLVGVLSSMFIGKVGKRVNTSSKVGIF